MDNRNAKLRQQQDRLRTEIMSLRSSVGSDSSSSSFMCKSIHSFADELLQTHYSPDDTTIHSKIDHRSSSSTERDYSSCSEPPEHTPLGEEQLVDVVVSFDRKLKSLEVKLRGTDNGILNSEIIGNINSKLNALLSNDTSFDELITDLKKCKLSIQSVLAASSDGGAHASVGNKVTRLLRAKEVCDNNAASLSYIRSLLQQINTMNIYLANFDAKMALLTDKVRVTRESVRANDSVLLALEAELQAFSQQVGRLQQ